MSKGNLFVISAPSGSGKTTIIRKLLKKIKNLHFSISCTTREKRKGEREGKDYYFISENTFKRMVEKEEFIEWAKVHNFYYGTKKSEVFSWIEKGKDVLLDIDTQGSFKIKKKYPESIHIFLLPPSFKELEKRLKDRGDLNESQIKKRLENAKIEIKRLKNYDYIIVNDKIENALNALVQIINSSKFKFETQKEKIEGIISSFL